MTKIITDFVPEYVQICQTKPYLFVKIAKDMVFLNTM